MLILTIALRQESSEKGLSLSDTVHGWWRQDLNPELPESKFLPSHYTTCLDPASGQNCSLNTVRLIPKPMVIPLRGSAI